MLVAKVSDNNMASISMSGENDHPLVLIRRSDSWRLGADIARHEIYMENPRGIVEPDWERLVCELKKSLYGLKQAPR